MKPIVVVPVEVGVICICGQPTQIAIHLNEYDRTRDCLGTTYCDCPHCNKANRIYLPDVDKQKIANWLKQVHIEDKNLCDWAKEWPLLKKVAR